MGYCNTTGVRAIDYILSDHLIDPAGQHEFYSETLLRLPRSICCYTPPDYAPAVKTGAAMPGATVTFGCFNNLTKSMPRWWRYGAKSSAPPAIPAWS